MADEDRQDTPSDEEQEPTAAEPTGDAAPDAAADEAEAPEAAADEVEAPEAVAEADGDEAAAEAVEPDGSETAADADADAGDASPDAEAEAPEAAAEAGGDEAAAEAGDAAPDAAGDEAPAEKPKPKRSRKKDAAKDEPEVIPGAHLEPDLVLEEDKSAAAADELGYGEDVGTEADASADAESEDDDVDHGPLEAVLDFAADARYRATGKRKRAVARVTIKPGSGAYLINGRSLEEYFPRPTLQRQARRPLETVGQEERMDVVATIHGGGVSAQAGALRHGITRALVEADPNLRGELKRRGFLTRDPRVKERKKAGLKKARKRPQFSKR